MGSKTSAKSLATNTDSGGFDWDIFVNVSNNLAGVRVTCMGGVSGDTMVLLDDGIEDISKVLVRVSIASIDATMLGVELDSTGNSLSKGEARGGGLVLAQLIPLLLGHMLGHQRVGRLDLGEGSHFLANR